MHLPYKIIEMQNRYRLFLGLWCLIILYLSWNPGIQIPKGFLEELPIDKIGHFGMYAIMSIISFKAFVNWANAKIFLFCFTFGILMEILQYAFFPGRYFEWSDIMANALGALVGITLIRKLIIKH